MSAPYRLSDLPERIARKITVDPETGCWIWAGYCTPEGYGHVKWLGRTEGIHRVVYMLLEGPIPDGLTLDHVKARGCVFSACCWPAHLEPVTPSENGRRLTVNCYRDRDRCDNGHEYTAANTYMWHGWRQCRACKRDYRRRQLAKMKEFQ
jgi:hypothetical protein